MPQTNQAKKELRKSAKRSEFNLAIKQDLKTLIKKTRKAIENKESKVEEMLKQVQKSVDKAVQKGVIKANTGSRKLSRLYTAYKKSKQSQDNASKAEDKKA